MALVKLIQTFKTITSQYRLPSHPFSKALIPSTYSASVIY